MKFSIACILATLALASAQDTGAAGQTVKERLVEHRSEMFENQQVST
jgi:hypothetical protein